MDRPFSVGYRGRAIRCVCGSRDGLEARAGLGLREAEAGREAKTGCLRQPLNLDPKFSRNTRFLRHQGGGCCW